MTVRPLVVATAVLLLTTVAAAQASEPIMPLSQVHRGMRCTGLSVAQGTDISSFGVEILEVVAGDPADRDPLILVRVSGPAVDQTGIAEGFSGSPISCPAHNGAQPAPPPQTGSSASRAPSPSAPATTAATSSSPPRSSRSSASRSSRPPRPTDAP